MNIVSLELSKELYKLSKWSDTDEQCSEIVNHRSKWYPAYDLGYLLRKLPETIERDGLYTNIGLAKYSSKGAGWRASYGGTYNKGLMGSSFNSPEDAVAKVAIKLFKEGLLERDK